VAPSTKYEYDGEGRRVRAHSCSGTSTCAPGSSASTTIFVYDAFGKLTTEYRPETAPSGTNYYTQDHLGSTRLETNASAQQVKCSDYLPFGEEIPAGYGSRSSCFNPNDNKIKFTSKERDAETGLDYFLARYYSGAQGRFLSPDEFKGGIVDPYTGQQISQPGPLPYADIWDPQTLNKYGYVRNNTLRFVDPDGHNLLDTILNKIKRPPPPPPSPKPPIPPPFALLVTNKSKNTTTLFVNTPKVAKIVQIETRVKVDGNHLKENPGADGTFTTTSGVRTLNL
jgi:RHS repeat-associated protein